MQYVVDLSKLDTERYFIIGDVLGDHDRMINMFYQQRVGGRDTLIFTGNFINVEDADSPINSSQLSNVLFIKNVMNAYSVKGKNEFDFLRKLEQDVQKPQWIAEHEKADEILKFIGELPLIIKVSEYLYVVNAGIQPDKSIKKQEPDVFYSIGEYDKDSRFYQFDNPESKSWYDFDMKEGDIKNKFCFGGKDIGKVEVPAGYCLGRNSINDPIRALILRKGQHDPILIEA